MLSLCLLPATYFNLFKKDVALFKNLVYYLSMIDLNNNFEGDKIMTEQKRFENAQEAKTFEQHSVINANILEAECEECEGYQDWFTFNRWIKQGYVVNKGEHGTKITVIFKTKVRVDPATELKMTKEEIKRSDSRGEPKFYGVAKMKRNVSCFCRHQVRQDVEAADRMMNRKNNKRKAA